MFWAPFIVQVVEWAFHASCFVFKGRRKSGKVAESSLFLVVVGAWFSGKFGLKPY